MMNYPVIELKAIAAYRNIQYLQFKQPLVEYVNNAIKDAEFMDHAMDYTREVYERWFSNRGNDDYRILSRDVIYGFIGKSGENAEAMDGRYRQAEFFLSYCLGVYCNANKDENIVPFILSLGIDNDWTGFAITYNPDRDVLSGIMDSDRLSQKELLKALTRCRRCDEGFEGYYDSLSLEEKLKLIDSPSFETDFFALYEYLILPVTLMVKYGDFGLVADFLHRYSIAPVQQQCLTGFREPQSILSLFDAVSSRHDKDDNDIVLQHVVMHHWYESLLTVAKDYALPYEGKNTELRALWSNLGSEFKNNETSLIQDSLRTFVNALGPETIARWIFSKHPLTPLRETLDSKITNGILAGCKEQAQAIIGISGFNPEVRDLEYISSFAQYFTDHDGDSDVYGLIRDSIFEALKTDRRYLSDNITDSLLRGVHIFATFLYKRFGNDIERMFKNGLDTVAVRYEGILATPESELYERANTESQFLLIFLYLTSFIDDRRLAVSLFKEISVYTLSQCVYCPNDTLTDSNYQRVLDMCELIAAQCLPEVKDEFERDCVNIFPDIATLIFVFAKSRIGISAYARVWLTTKSIRDWNILKCRLVSRTQRQYADNLQKALDAVLV